MYIYVVRRTPAYLLFVLIYLIFLCLFFFFGTPISALSIGLFVAADGTTLPCEYMSGAIITGRGTCEMRDGSKYSGDWLNGKRHGVGVLSNNDEVIYEGEWENDTPVE